VYVFCAFVCAHVLCVRMCVYSSVWVPTCCAVTRQDQHSGVAGGACVYSLCVCRCWRWCGWHACCAGPCLDKIDTAEWLEVRMGVGVNVGGVYAVLCCVLKRPAQRNGWM
jgi:hypothetical protein